MTGVVSENIGWRPTNLVARFSGLALITVLTVTLLIPITRSLIWRAGADTTTSYSEYAPILVVLTTVISLPIAVNSVHNRSTLKDRWLGDLSYPLYLFHWIPRNWYYANVDWSTGSIRNGSLLLANFGFAIVGAILLLQLVDRPAQRMRLRYSSKRNEINSDQLKTGTGSVD